MNQLNSIILEGNVVKQSELKEPVQGFKVCNFSIAVNRYYKTKNGDTKEEVSFFDVETTGKMAESAGDKCLKGRGVRIVGRLKQERWKDSSEHTQSKVVVVAEHIEYKPQFNKEKNATSDNLDAIKEAEMAAVTQEVYEEAANF